MKNFYVTTPIYYPSAKLHLGHAYTTIAADVLKKYKQADGYNAYFLTGSDEHGQKIEKKALAAGMEPIEFTTEIVDQMKSLWNLLDIDYDQFIRTTDQKHMTQVQDIFERLLKQGDIYLGEYEGKYCTSCESYFTDTQLINGKCPDCGNDLIVLKEEAYFFNCAKYIDRLLAHMEANADFILPISRKNEIINNFIKPGLQDLAVSRTNFEWGIPVRSNPKHVTYVWIDALSNYITALNFQEQSPEFDKFWPADIQLVGKEIIRFHVIYWPMLLMALDLPLPKQIFAHGWLLMDEDKMSKSKGNVIYPEYLVENYGVDTVRYYLMREVPFGDDGQFTPETFVKRINNDIVNDLGNLVNRTVAMSNKYFTGSVTMKEDAIASVLSNYPHSIAETFTVYQNHMDKLQFSRALEALWKFISDTNKFIDLTTPWAVAKDEERRDELEAIMYILLNSLRQISILLHPFLNRTAKFIQTQIGLNSEFKFSEINYVNNQFKVNPNPEVLLNRLDVEQEVKKIATEMHNTMKRAQRKLKNETKINLENFKQSELIVAEIIEVKKHKDAKKLLVLKIDTGYELKQVVSGLAQYYEAEQLIGKKVVVVNNLEPVTIRGEESQAMILTTEFTDQVTVLEVDVKTENGAEIK